MARPFEKDRTSFQKDLEHLRRFRERLALADEDVIPAAVKEPVTKALDLVMFAMGTVFNVNNTETMITIERKAAKMFDTIQSLAALLGADKGKQ